MGGCPAHREGNSRFEIWLPGAVSPTPQAVHAPIMIRDAGKALHVVSQVTLSNFCTSYYKGENCHPTAQNTATRLMQLTILAAKSNVEASDPCAASLPYLLKNTAPRTAGGMAAKMTKTSFQR